MDHLVVAPAAAKVARPAAATGFLAVDHALREPASLPLAIDPLADMAHGAGFVLDEPMACEQPAGGGNAEVAGSGPARIRPVRAAVNLHDRRANVGERRAIPAPRH